MTTIDPQYITDNKGKKISAIIPIKQFKTIVNELDELEDIKLYDETKSKKAKSYPIEKAFKIIEAKRRKK